MTRKEVSLAAGALLLGAVCGIAGWRLYRNRSCTEYRYINSAMACGEQRVISKAAYVALSNDLLAYIGVQEAAGTISKLGVFFRDLHDGPVFGINEDLDFVPASLMKLPLVFTYFNLATENPDVLRTPLVYSKLSIKDYEIPGQIEQFPGELQEGERYPADVLMRHAIVFSDNVAYYVLLEQLRNDPNGTYQWLRTFRDLNIVDATDISAEVVSVHTYASLFRLLYSAAYLNAEDSETVLSWLAQSTYRKGLIAGVPEGTIVANKFGERLLPDGTKQLHDCGIIYYPDNPYILCVMTKGQEWDALAKTIATISRMVYAEVDSRRLKNRGPH